MRQEWVCKACLDIFDQQVWHCPWCAHHWLMHEKICRNCHKGSPCEWGTAITVEDNEE